MSIPIIAVLPLYDDEANRLFMQHTYTDCIHNAEGLPVVLPFGMSQKEIKEADKFIDGYLFTGGHDVNPAFYKAENEYCQKLAPCRDELEKSVFDVAYKSGKPILGICRGFQLINALLGGTLYQDVPMLVSDKIVHTVGAYPKMAKHTVKVFEGTPLYDIGGSEIVVNSYHHQGVKTLADGLVKTCESADGLTEGYYAPDKKFLMGFQCHPERKFDEDDWSEQIWKMFINAAKKETDK